ncbi:Panacea domain-containing protein [Desulfonema magnum]|uniref:Panacea domain-containing protein n=1 Tax=Desulfonema magnum TaxID=45655 RepID=UPI001A9BF7E1
MDEKRFHLAIHDKPLFDEEIEVWTYGPAVPELYSEYKKYGSGHIPSPTDTDFSVFDEETRSLLDEVHAVFGQYRVLWHSLISLFSIFKPQAFFQRPQKILIILPTMY